MSAIQRERERREQLRAEEEALRLDKAAQAEAERQQFIKRRESAGAENRHFLEELKIPEYLQTRIDEKRLKGAYVLWWEKYPIAGYEAHGRNPGFMRVSLVWNIGYIEESYTRPAERIDHSWLSPGSGGTYPIGYAFKAVNVDGNAKEGSLVVHGATKIGEKYVDTSFYEGGRRYVDRYPPGGNRWNLVIKDVQTRLGFFPACFEMTQTPKKVILCGEKLNQPEAIERTLASVYFDTVNWAGHFEIREDYPHRTGSWPFAWPFDRSVPEQKQKSERTYSLYAARMYF